jgi:hypothetical protein
MADPEYVAARWREILDGKKAWDIKELLERDEDVFHVQYVLPLRQLRDEGRIDRIVEGDEIGSRGTTRVFITGGINYTA